MTQEKAKGPGYEYLHLRADDLACCLVHDFTQNKRLRWPVVPKSKLHKVWSDFSATGKVADEQAFWRIQESMQDSLCHLLVANIVSGHEQVRPSDYLEDHLDLGSHDAFCNWLISDDSGYWRISDYGTRPLMDAIALAYEAKTLPAKLKYLDRALHVTHMRGDLSRLFVEGGRDTVLSFGLCGQESVV